MVDELEPDALEEEEQGIEEEEEVKPVEKDELAELREQLQEERQARAKIEGKLEGLGKEKPEPIVEDPFAYLDGEDFKENFFENPENALRPVKDLIRLTGTALLARDKKIDELERRLNGMSVSDPEVDAKVSELMKNPKLAGLPREALEEIAKISPKPRKREFPGEAPSGGRASPSGGDPKMDKLVAKKLAEIYGED